MANSKWQIALILTFLTLTLAPVVLAQEVGVDEIKQMADPSVKRSFLPACKPTGDLPAPGNSVDYQNPNHRCGVYDLLQLVVNLTRWLWYMSIPLAGALFLYAGYLIMTAAGDEGQVGQGKKIITAAVVGFIIVMTSWLLVRTIFYILAPGYTGGLSQ